MAADEVRLEQAWMMREWKKCSKSPAYFLYTYGHIYDNESEQWIPFHLWPEQREVVEAIHHHQFTAWLKARQLGLSWIGLGYGLWRMLFRPIATCLFLSKRDDEAVYLLSDERLRGMYRRLPIWMQCDHIVTDNDHMLELSNGSTARAFPTSAGDSYTATYVMVDEADLVPDLGRILRAVKPTVADGGKLVLVSRADKSKPRSLFKQIYRAGKQGLNEWRVGFLPWHVRPGRDLMWYRGIVRDTLNNTGGMDDVYEQYPATDEEALAPAALDKRIPAQWLRQCYAEESPIALDGLPEGAPDIPGLRVFRLPRPDGHYVGGMDCAEGLPSSDDSATDIVDAEVGEQVAMIAGKLTPETHAAYSAALARWYNRAPLLVENNNHGWTAILWLKDYAPDIKLLRGHNDKDGWSTTSLSKVILYDEMAEACRHRQVIIHDMATMTQLQSIEKGTLKAPPGELDDSAISFALAHMARLAPQESTVYDDSVRVRIGW